MQIFSNELIIVNRIPLPVQKPNQKIISGELPAFYEPSYEMPIHRDPFSRNPFHQEKINHTPQPISIM